MNDVPTYDFINKFYLYISQEHKYTNLQVQNMQVPEFSNILCNFSNIRDDPFW